MDFGPWYSGIKVVNISKVYITHTTSTHHSDILILHYTHYIYTYLYIGPEISKFYITSTYTGL